jgi:serine/threonine-protein kinase SRPK3
MIENKRLFDVLDPKTGNYENRFHLAIIVGLLGPPPLEFLQRSEFSSVYFDEIGECLIAKQVFAKLMCIWQVTGSV